MPYDSSLDQQVFSKSFDSKGERVTVSVYSYNNGPRKLQITREVPDQEGNFRFSKLGRLSKEETETIIPLIQDALKQM